MPLLASHSTVSYYGLSAPEKLVCKEPIEPIHKGQQTRYTQHLFLPLLPPPPPASFWKPLKKIFGVFQSVFVILAHAWFVLSVICPLYIGSHVICIWLIIFDTASLSLQPLWYNKMCRLILYISCPKPKQPFLSSWRFIFRYHDLDARSTQCSWVEIASCPCLRNRAMKFYFWKEEKCFILIIPLSV